VAPSQKVVPRPVGYASLATSADGWPRRGGSRCRHRRRGTDLRGPSTRSLLLRRVRVPQSGSPNEWRSPPDSAGFGRAGVTRLWS